MRQLCAGYHGRKRLSSSLRDLKVYMGHGKINIEQYNKVNRTLPGEVLLILQGFRNEKKGKDEILPSEKTSWHSTTLSKRLRGDATLGEVTFPFV
jgi:hypothetical protein